MRQECSFALPTPVLTGSGYVSMFSVPELRDTPLQNFHYKGIREFFLCKKSDAKKEGLILNRRLR